MSGLIPRLLALFLAGYLIGAGSAQAQPLIPIANGFLESDGFARDDGGHFFIADTIHHLLQEVASPSAAAQPLGAGLGLPFGVAADGAGNVFVVDNENSVIKELFAASGYLTNRIIASGFDNPKGIALDRQGNLFVADGIYLKEVTVASGYQTVIVLGNGFQSANALAFDSAGNLFVVTSTKLWKIPSTGGYNKPQALGATFTNATALAVDPNSNVYVVDSGALTIDEVTAAGGYAHVQIFSTGIPASLTLAIDKSGNIFAGDPVNQFVAEFLASTKYAQYDVYEAGFRAITALALDPAGDLFITDRGNSTVKELYASTGYATGLQLETGFIIPSKVAVDGAGNVFVSDAVGIKRLPASSGYALVETIWSGFGPFAIDRNGNLFIDTGSAVVEATAVSGYADTVTIETAVAGVQAIGLDSLGNLYTYKYELNVFDAASGYTNYKHFEPITNAAEATGLIVDPSGNVLISSSTGVWEMLAGDYSTPVSLLGFSSRSMGLALDAAGDLFLDYEFSQPTTIWELPAPTIVASVLPGARSVAVSGTATLFASIANTSPTPAANCQIGLPYWGAPYGLQVQYQQTDPTTNVPTGQVDTPVTIPGQSVQSFLLTFWSDHDGTNEPFYAPTTPLRFFCNGGADAPVVAGVNTIDLNMQSDPGADIIAIIATPTNNGIMALPNGGTGAFAIATSNLGAAQAVTASIDAGAATLPLSAEICQTDPTTGQCLAAPAASIPVSFAAGDAPTFSAFLAAGGAISLAPAGSRIFIRFTDASGIVHGETSVAVETQ